MKTSAISNLPVNTGASQSVKPDSPSESSFGQMFSREIQNRSKPSEPQRTRAKESNASESQVKTNQAGSSDKPAAPAGEKTASVAKDTTKTDRESAAESASRPSDVEETAAADAPAELLALVAQLNQIVAPPAAGQKTGEADAANDTETTEPDLSLLADGKQQAADTTIALASTATQLASAGNQPAMPKPVSPDTALQAAPAGKPASLPPEALPAEAQAGETLAPAADAKASATQVDGGKSAAQAGFAAAVQAAAAEAKAGKTTQENTPSAAPVTSASLPPVQAQPVQQAQQLAAAVPEASNHIAPRVGNPGWDQAVGQKVVWMVSGGIQSASLILNPPELGPLQVVLSVSNNEATAEFTAAQPEVRQALETAMPKLREMLGDAGIQLGGASVNAGNPNHQQNGFGQQSRSRQNGDHGDDAAEATAPVTATKVISAGEGLVDTFA